MKKILAIILCATLLLSMAACDTGNADAEHDEAIENTKPVDTYPYPTINEKLTWEKINAFPIKSEDMTVQEMRELCVAFMRFSKTAMWIPNTTVEYIRNAGGTPDTMYKGEIYAGFPYVRLGTGNVYRLMDHLDEETGVVDMSFANAAPTLLGNQCTSNTYWAWARVINSMKEVYTTNMTQENGYIRVGPYTYDDSQERFSEEYSTKMICAENGLDVMFRSYAQLHLADGLVNYNTAGHTIMVSSEPHIEYVDGNINPATSYITILEQGQNWVDYTNESGDTAQTKNSIDKKMTFMDLYDQSYIPFTFAEFLGEKGIDKTECRINLSGDSVEGIKLFNAMVTANFGISDVYVSLKNADGKEVYRLAVYADSFNVREMNIKRNGTNTFEWGDYDKLSGEYFVEVSVQLSTGERPVVYSGKVSI